VRFVFSSSKTFAPVLSTSVRRRKSRITHEVSRRSAVSTSFAAQVVTENPYRLVRNIRGIGFKSADAIAMKLGIEETAMIRLCDTVRVG
jgi:Helix-hairpin-helix containing domain